MFEKDRERCFYCPYRDHTFVKDAIAAIVLQDDSTAMDCDGPIVEARHFNTWEESNGPDTIQKDIHGCGKDPAPQDGVKELHFKSGVLRRIVWPNAESPFEIIKDNQSSEYNQIRPL